MAEFPNKATQFAPGQSGNPGGSSKKQRLTARLHKLLDDAAEEGFIQVAIDAAKGRNNDAQFNFWKYIYERIDGPMPVADVVPPVSMSVLDQLESIVNEPASSQGDPGVQE